MRTGLLTVTQRLLLPLLVPTPRNPGELTFQMVFLQRGSLGAMVRNSDLAHLEPEQIFNRRDQQCRLGRTDLWWQEIRL